MRNEPQPVLSDPSAPAGADLRAWSVVVAGFVSMFTVFGVAYSFGAFFGPMADEFGSERGATALFFAITTFLYFGLGVVSGRLADRFGPRPVLLAGAVALGLGLIATAQVQSLWLGYLTYGVGVGIGVACGYVPMVAAVGAWFVESRSTALGIAVAGIGAGTLLLAPLSEVLIDRYGWRDTYVILGVGSAILLGLASLGAHRPPTGPGGDIPIPLRESIGGSRAFAALYLSMFLLTLVLFVPFVFLADYLTDRSIGGSAGLLVGIIGLASVLGRLGLGATAARFGSNTVYRGSIVALALSQFLWLFAGGSYSVLVLFTLVFGLAYGGFIALAPAVTAEVFGTDGLGGILGALYTSAGFGGLIGPPLIGSIIDRSGYRVAIVIAIIFSAASAAAIARLHHLSPRTGNASQM